LKTSLLPEILTPESRFTSYLAAPSLNAITPLLPTVAAYHGGQAIILATTTRSLCLPLIAFLSKSLLA
jgi:hypothetical protein